MAFALQIFKNKAFVKEYELSNGQSLIFGRAAIQGVEQLNDQSISSKHMNIFAENNKLYIRDLDSSNGTFIGQDRLDAQKKYGLKDKNQIFVSQMYSIVVKEKQASAPPIPIKPPIEEKEVQNQLNELLKTKNRITIGRDKSCDIVLDSLVISRQHAVISKEGTLLQMEVISHNGVYLNNNFLKKGSKTSLQNNDLIKIGSFALGLQAPLKNLRKSNEAAIVAEGIVKRYSDKIGLHKTSFTIRKKEFVALMGPSGCGKSTLLKCLNAVNPITEGTVKINGFDLKTDYEQIKRQIGYVPQDDIVHRDLSVNDTMFYAAKLRLDDDVSESEMAQKIDKVLASLNMNDPKDRSKIVSELSGGQRKRISIAVEMLNDPSILFLDEPTSPLDPETIDEFLKCIKTMADQADVTIVMVTHKPDDLEYADKIIFLSKGGFLTFFGDKNEVKSHFNAKDLIEIYKIHSNPQKGEQLYQEWNNNPKSSVFMPIGGKTQSTNNSMMMQLWWLTRRYLAIKLSDKQNMALLIAQPLIIGFLLGFIFKGLQIGVLFMVAISAVWFGVSNAAKEIVGEIPIYMRERMYNMSIFNYLASKLLVLTVLASMQVIIFVAVLSYFFKVDPIQYMGIGLKDHMNYILFMLYLSVSATLLGLLLSSLFQNTEQVMTVVPIFLIPQIMLAGVITKIDTSWKEIMSYFTLGRWGTEGLSRIQDNEFTAVLDTIIAIDQEKNKKGIVTKINYDTLIPDPDLPPVKGIFNQIPDFVAAEDSLRLVNGKQIPYLYENQKDTVASALDLVGFYKKTETFTPFEWVNSFNHNLIAILLLNLLVFSVLYISLKRKDTV